MAMLTLKRVEIVEIVEAVKLGLWSFFFMF